MTQWKRQTPARPGTYEFSGFALATRGVAEVLSKSEIKAIIQDVRHAVAEAGGLDYLQIYKNDSGEKLYVIDQLNREMLASDGYTEEQKQKYNYFTIILPEEY